MQVLRINKLDLFPVICRCYGTQRSHRNYYEILEVAPNCSQKEIRKAFLILSKKWHPDIIGNKGHDKFVKLQEAYNVLSKEDTRRQYDMNLKYYKSSPYSSSHVRSEDSYYYGPVYKSRREWEEYMAKGRWHAGSPDPKDLEARRNKLLVIYTICGIIIISIQFIGINYKIFHSKRNLQYEYQKDYNLLKKNIQGLELQQQINIVQDRYNTSQNKKEEKNKKEQEK